MHRFYIPHQNWNPDALTLDEGEAHHAIDVLRMKSGERAVVFNGRGAEMTAEIGKIEKNRVHLRGIQGGSSPRLACEITLGQAIPKGKNMDFIVQKATELGVHGIVPLVSERTIVRVEEADGPWKQDKWQAVVIEAAKQCGQNWLPAVEAPVPMKEYFKSAPKFDLMLIASLQPDAKHPRAVLDEYKENHDGTPPKSVLVLIGPEGDFTPAELGLAKSNGARPISLGPIVLRTETAAIYSLSILAYELQHLQ